MTGIFGALTDGFGTVAVGRVMLHKYIGPLKAREQCFKFHELRDRLQVIAVEGKIEIGSETYQLLLFIINLSIRNAGVMKLSEILKAAKAIEKRVNASTSERVFADIRSHNQEVQHLSAVVFDALPRMLISNDAGTLLFAKIIEFNHVLSKLLP